MLETLYHVTIFILPTILGNAELEDHSIDSIVPFH